MAAAVLGRSGTQPHRPVPEDRGLNQEREVARGSTQAARLRLAPCALRRVGLPKELRPAEEIQALSTRSDHAEARLEDRRSCRPSDDPSNDTTRSTSGMPEPRTC